MFHIGFRHNSSLSTPDSKSLIISNSIAAVVKAPVFGQNLEFGEKFASNYKCQSFGQLVNTASKSMYQVQRVADKQNSSTGTGFRYSPRSYGRMPIVEPFYPLKKDVTILLDFDQFDNFGTLEWD